MRLLSVFRSVVLGRILILLLGGICVRPMLAADLKLAGVFTDHMVLQRDMPVPVWGWADAGERVTVEFAGQKKIAVADAAGKWSVKLDPMPVSAAPQTLTARGVSVVTKTDVLVGDVWLCSGQSNMGVPMDIPNDYLQRRIREANNPQLRLIQIVHNFPDQPAADLNGDWRLAQSNAVGNWIAIGYLFGDRIQTELGVPVGIIAGAMGGTPISSWVSREVLAANPTNDFIFRYHETLVKQLPVATAKYEKELAAFRRRFPDARARAIENTARRQRGEPEVREPREPEGSPGSPRNPAACYNGKIAPLAPFAIRGVLWYQGENNVTRFAEYPSQMTDLMRSWRALFGLPQLPFLMTELAPFHPPAAAPEDSERARFGEALAQTAKADGNAWVITIVDGGDPKNIHPAKKEIPGERFAAMALAKVYGRAGIAHGPLFESWRAEQGRAVVKFSSVGGGLAVKAMNLGGHAIAGDAPHGFELAGDDRKFFRATARIEGGDTVVVSCPEVASPAAVRYAWAGFPLCNLFNREGFAAYPFRTDDWPWPTPEAGR
ncbi:MAG: sialate O-acetylesterase [Verrucomicrobia bacterium]|nr:sialate O-acetylesterase [Verrucomicrobiota bacterium]